VDVVTETVREKRKRREVEVGLANNAVGAGAGTIATASAVRAVRGHDYKPKTKLGARAVARMGRMGVSPKRAILAAGVGNVALQAGNGLLDAQSAGYFARERARMGEAKKSFASGVWKPVTEMSAGHRSQVLGAHRRATGMSARDRKFKRAQAVARQDEGYQAMVSAAAVAKPKGLKAKGREVPVARVDLPAGFGAAVTPRWKGPQRKAGFAMLKPKGESPVEMAETVMPGAKRAFERHELRHATVRKPRSSTVRRMGDSRKMLAEEARADSAMKKHRGLSAYRNAAMPASTTARDFKKLPGIGELDGATRFQVARQSRDAARAYLGSMPQFSNRNLDEGLKRYRGVQQKLERKGLSKGLEMKRGTFDQGNGHGRRITDDPKAEPVGKALPTEALTSWAMGTKRLRNGTGRLSGKVMAPQTKDGMLQVDPAHPAASNTRRNAPHGDPRWGGRTDSMMQRKNTTPRRARSAMDFTESLRYAADEAGDTLAGNTLRDRRDVQLRRMSANAKRQMEMRGNPSKRRVPLTAKNTPSLRYREDPVGAYFGKNRRFDPEADRQRRMGLYSGAAAGGALVAAHTAKPQWTLTDAEGKATKVGEGKKIHGLKVLNRRKGVGRAALAAGLGTAAAGTYARGVSARNQPWT
jgi:hypothetical protein